jgi:hypothetical protein
VARTRATATAGRGWSKDASAADFAGAGREPTRAQKKGPTGGKVRPAGPFNREKQVLPESGNGRHTLATDH